MTYELSNWQQQILHVLTGDTTFVDPKRSYQAGTKTVADFVATIEQDRAANPEKYFDFPQVGNLHDYLTEVLMRNGQYPKQDGSQNTTARKVEIYDAYSLILEFISVKDNLGFAKRDGDGLFETPLEEVDQFVWVFLHGARATNLDAQGASSGLSRLGILGKQYNNAQYINRYGPTDLKILNAKTLEASNKIAIAIAQQFAEGTTPSLWTIGQADGQEGAIDLWRHPSFGPRGLGDNIGGWAGTPFFLMLGEEGFYERDILYYTGPGEDKKDVKPVLAPTFDRISPAYLMSTMYDLLSMAVAYKTAGLIASSDNTDVTFNGVFHTVMEGIGSISGESGFDEVLNFIRNSIVTGDAALKAGTFIRESYGTLPTSLIEDLAWWAIRFEEPVFGPMFSSLGSSTKKLHKSPIRYQVQKASTKSYSTR